MERKMRLFLRKINMEWMRVSRVEKVEWVSRACCNSCWDIFASRQALRGFYYRYIPLGVFIVSDNGVVGVLLVMFLLGT